MVSINTIAALLIKYRLKNGLFMIRQTLSFIGETFLGSSVILTAKAIFDSRLRGPVSNIQDQKIDKWCSNIRQDGVCMVDNFLPTHECVNLRKEIDFLMNLYLDSVQLDEHEADQRLFLGGTAPGQIGSIYGDPRLATCASAFLGIGAENLATIAGRLNMIPGNHGSGGGWHRDSFTNQFKAIIYLSDVGKDNGPFQYLRGSHSLSSMICDRQRAELGVMQSRVRNDQISKLVDRNPARLMTLTGGPGTLMLADTTGLHRGMPITAGSRYALTNYYFAPNTLTASRKDHFKPILGVHVPYIHTANSSIDSM